MGLQQDFLNGYPNLKDCAIQIFSDDKKNKIAEHFPVSKLKEKFEYVKELNLKWCWIFFSVNSMQEWFRDKEHTTNINTWIVECDSLNKQEQMNLINKSPLKPSMIIESNKSYHIYFFAKDWDTESYSEIQKRLKDYFYWDQALVSDYARVLRFPWFYHMKWEKFKINVINYNWNLYTKEEIRNNFELKEIKKEIKKQIKQYDWNDIWDLMTTFDSKQMLVLLSWTYLVNWDLIEFSNKNQIICNWKETWCWIDWNWLIGSNDKWWPTWIQWILWYWKIDKKDLLKWTLDNCRHLIPQKFYSPNFETLNVKKDYIDPIDIIESNPFTWWTHLLDKTISPIERHHQIIFSWETNSWKTAFTFDMAIKNAQLWHRVLYLSLEMDSEDILTRIARSYAWIDKEQWRDKNKISETQKNAYKYFKEKIKNIDNLFSLWFNKEQSKNVDDICKVIETSKCDLCYIDNLDLIDSKKWMTNIENDEYKSKKLMEFTNYNKIPVIIIHHYNKWTEKSHSKPRSIHSIKWSSKIIHNADTVIIWFRDLTAETKHDKAKFTLIQWKDRDFGIWWTAIVYFNKWTFQDETISNIAETYLQFN